MTEDRNPLSDDRNDDGDSKSSGAYIKRISDYKDRLLLSPTVRKLLLRRRKVGLITKTVSFAGGVVLVLLSSMLIADIFVNRSAYYGVGASAILWMILVILIFISGIFLIAMLPESLKVRFLRPFVRGQNNPTYGFYTMLAIGIGSTIGSPLFVLIPINVMQYAIISIISLAVAGSLSVGLGLVYSYQYRYTLREGIDVVGGSGIVRHSAGHKSLRYFITRISGWIANTALAAYSALLFVEFDFGVMARMFNSYGISSLEVNAIVLLIAAVFVLWFIINALFEKRFLRQIGNIQIILVIFMVLMLVIESLNLGFKGHWNMSGLLSFSGSNWLEDILLNTGYLYIIFFGFQEILTLNREGLEKSRIPFGKKLFGRSEVGKETYISAAVVLTVIISSLVNILFAVAVFSVKPSSSVIDTKSIPAIYIAREFTGVYWEVIMAFIFLIASVTTFVPAFFSASRHLGALGEDGFLPKAIASLSWVITLLLIAVLYTVNSGFLVSITDFMILISLALISLSAIWLKKTKLIDLDKWQKLAIVVAGLGFVSAAALYIIEAPVVIFGVFAILLTYLLYDVLDLGQIGTSVFLLLLDAGGMVMTLLFPYPEMAVIRSPIPIPAAFSSESFLIDILLVSVIILGINLFLDIMVLGRTSYRKKIFT
ncbi:MAG: APC family permease [Thermoplasmata archaeon]